MSREPENPRILRDPYLEWCAGEGVPIVEEFAVNLHHVETAPWPRIGADAAFVHLKGRGDFISIFVLDLPPGAKSAPQKHLYEEVVYVLSGHGSPRSRRRTGASTRSNGDRRACSRCRSMPATGTSRSGGRERRGSPAPTALP